MAVPAYSILKDEKRIFPCCVRLNGQYKLKDIFVGAPVKLGKKGVQEIVKLRLKKRVGKLCEGKVSHRSASRS
jgi:malate dehydrogenase